MKFENNNFKILRVTAEQLIKNEYDRVKLDVFRSSINFYEERIKQLSEIKNNEERKFGQFLANCINSVDVIEKYKSPGSIIVCENLIFFCDGERWFTYRKDDNQ